RPDTSAVSTPPRFSPDGKLVLESLYEQKADGPAPAAGGGGPAGGGLALAGGGLSEGATGRELPRLEQADGFLGPCAVAPDGRSLVTVTSKQQGKGEGSRYDNALHFWELATGKERLTLACGNSDRWLWQIAYTPNGRTLATVRADNTFQFWDLVTAK